MRHHPRDYDPKNPAVIRRRAIATAAFFEKLAKAYAAAGNTTNAAKARRDAEASRAAAKGLPKGSKEVRS